MNVKQLSERFVKAIRLYRTDFPLVGFLSLTSKVISALLDPKITNSRNLDLAQLSPVEFDSIVNPSGNPALKSPYLSDEGKDELRKQMSKSLLLSTEKMPSRRFCLFAENYLLPSRVDFSFARAISVSQLIKKFLASECANKEKWEILSIGCRDAIEIAFLKRYFQHLPALQVTGLDISTVDDVNIVKGDMHNMPFEANKFDIIISSHSLEHCVEPKQVANEIKRVAKQNAVIGIEVPAKKPAGTSPIWIEEGADNWDYCNPTVLCGLFGENVKLISHEVTPQIMRVVIVAS